MAFDLEDKNSPPEFNDEEIKNDDKNTTADTYTPGLDCFEEKPTEKGYILPDAPLKLEFLENKR